MTPEMIAALSQKRAQITGFFEFGFASGTRNLMLGSGEVDYLGVTFKGSDPTFGSVSAGQEVNEDATGEAPNTSITIAVAPTADKADIASAAVQLTPVKISLAALTLDNDKHLIAIPDPELIFDGFVDQAIVNLDKKKDEVDYTIISAFDYFFEDSEGQRLSPSFYAQMYPTETGLNNVTGVARKIYWGQYGPGQSAGGRGGGGVGFGSAAGGGSRGFISNYQVPV
ncbi:MAG: hypothetical protein ACR652_17775 [Methylocystis sp.]|uniref:hypothetical protein n=1 Tax=Methylocystis sp. TaxID=1911079 RepID=UPI003DA2DA65